MFGLHGILGLGSKPPQTALVLATPPQELVQVEPKPAPRQSIEVAVTWKVQLKVSAHGRRHWSYSVPGPERVHDKVSDTFLGAQEIESWLREELPVEYHWAIDGLIDQLNHVFFEMFHNSPAN